MSTPTLDPNLPADNSPLSSGEMRSQFQAIQDRVDNAAQVQPVGLGSPTSGLEQAFARKLRAL